jgi:hypothetical protein
MYSKIEIDLSRSYLRTLQGSIPQPNCLVGGWSVYLIVNDAFQRDTGRQYLSSKDIDLGFHFDPEWDQKQFNNSPFGMAIIKMQQLGFESESFRFVKRFHASDGHELTAEESRRLQSYDIFPLYVDVLVDSASRKRFRMAKFKVAEELLLTRVFTGKEFLTRKLEGMNVMIPHPQLQMEMKIRSFPHRTTDDKKTKDLIDLCALILYTRFKPTILKNKSKGVRALTSYKRAVKKTKEEEWTIVSTTLDITVNEAKRVANLVL